MVERKDVGERYIKRRRMNMSSSSGYMGKTNVDTWEAMNTIRRFDSTKRNWSYLAADFNDEIKNGTFNEEKAKEALKKNVLQKALEKVKMEDNFDAFDINKVNMDELVDETILMTVPISSKKKNYTSKDIRESELEARCRERNMDYVPGYYKDDGTQVKGYCRHTKFTGYMREKKRR